MKRRVQNHQRGIALMMVIIGLAVLGLVAQEIRYNSIVEMRLATNQRDEVRAHFMARSGIGLARLLMKFQGQMNAIQLPPMPPAIQQLLGGAKLPTNISLQLWRMAKIDCYMLQAMEPEDKGDKDGIQRVSASRSKKFDFDDENPELAEAQNKRRFGGFEGCFNTEITDEGEKLNVSKLAAPQLAAQVVMMQSVTTFGDKKFEFLFEREDSNRVKVTPNDIIIALRDWMDDDQTASALNLSGTGEPFQKGFSDENYSYDKYDPRYRAKNANFDSFDELYMVHGINDKFMAAFGDKLTIFPDPNTNLNINTDDPVLLEIAIRSVADPSKPDPRLQDPIFIDALITKIRAARMFAMFGMSVADFVSVLQTAGVNTNPTITNNAQNNRFISDKSTTYRIRVTGEAGDVTKTITTVIRLDDGLGRLLTWKEE